MSYSYGWDARQIKIPHLVKQQSCKFGWKIDDYDYPGRPELSRNGRFIISRSVSTFGHDGLPFLNNYSFIDN